jgi:hypothetical protein
MNPMDAQRYDLAKRGLVSLIVSALRPSTDHF